jgi:hypothetical protein
MTDWSQFFTADQLRNAIRAAAASDITANTLPAFPTAADVAVLVFLPGATGPAWLVATATVTATATAASTDGLAKAWAYWGTTSATGLISGFPAGLTVSRTSSGEYTIDFGAKLFSASNYVFQTNCQQDRGTLVMFTGQNATGPNGQLASSFDFIAINSGGSPAEPFVMSAVFYGVT